LKDCPEEFVKFANRLADTAGEIHRRHFGKTLEVEIKPDGSPSRRSTGRPSRR
jgi:hypothetical protein